ncbi:MAG: cobS [Dehalococcoidia bacterium]|nr:cobS [Dehalococcoidia bacterium]
MALRFLTILPLPWPRQADAGATGRSLAFFPLVGLFIGLVMAGLDRALVPVFPPLVTGALLLGAMVVLTGGLHLDGFIDTCDGLARHGSLEEKRAAMRDSRVGAFGVIGVLSLMLVKYASVVSLHEESRTAALVFMPLLGRWSMVARPEGAGRVFKENASRSALVIATLAAAVPAFLLLGVQGLVILLSVWLLVWLWAGFLSRRFGGLTGDNYGAVSELAEVSVLVLILVFSGIGWEGVWLVRS